MSKGFVKITLPIVTTFLVVLFAVLNFSFTSFASQNNNNGSKVTICHRTNSATNPYVVITVDSNAVDGQAGNSGNTPDHYGEHKGPLASSQSVAQALKSAKIEWGDIIPPVLPFHNGLNWTSAGQAIYNNGCKYVVTSPSPSPYHSPSPSPSPYHSPTPSPRPTPSPTPTPNPTPTPSVSPSPSANPSPTPSVSPSPTPVVSPSPTPSDCEQGCNTNSSPTPSPTPSPDPTPDSTPSASPSTGGGDNNSSNGGSSSNSSSSGGQVAGASTGPQVLASTGQASDYELILAGLGMILFGVWQVKIVKRQTSNGKRW